MSANRNLRAGRKQPSLTAAEREKYAQWMRDISAGTYRPFIEVQSFPGGMGSRCMEYSVIEDRCRHLLSHGELYTVRLLEHLPTVVAIHEQYALPPETTLVIADELGLAHPAFGNSKVMTSDFLVEFTLGKKRYQNVLSYKPFDVMQHPDTSKDIRSREKQLIECHYWEIHRGIPWRLVTAEDVSPYLHYNMSFFMEAADADTCPHLKGLDDAVFDAFKRKFCRLLTTHSDLSTNELILLAAPAGMTYPVALRVFKHLAWHSALPIDLLQPVELNMPLPRLAP